MGNEQARPQPFLEDEDPELGRLPTDVELVLLFRIQQKILTRLVESPFHTGLLKRYWLAMTRHKQHDQSLNRLISIKNKGSETSCPFERKSPIWLTIGAQSENPGLDLRAGGQLGLECLVYFVENHTAEARMMNRVNGYPFIRAGIAITKVLCEIFLVIDEFGQKGKFPVAPKLYWQLLTTETSFYQLFSFAFVVMDEIFCNKTGKCQARQQQQCSQAILIDIVDETKAKLMEALQQAPRTLSCLGHIGCNARSMLDEKVNGGDLALLTRVASATLDAKKRLVSQNLPDRQKPFYSSEIGQTIWSDNLTSNANDDARVGEDLFEGMCRNVE